MAQRKRKTKRGGVRPGAGRPREDGAATETIHVRVAPDLAKQVRKAAGKSGVGAFARAALAEKLAGIGVLQKST